MILGDKAAETAWFWARVERHGAEACWPWVGGTHRSGYGQFKAGGQTFKAHRVALALTTGGVEWRSAERGARGQIVLHACDNRRCCNPAHLRVGTQRDNMRECSQRGRIGRGATHGRVKLTAAQVAEIKQLQADGVIGNPGRGWSRDVREGRTMSLATVGKRYGVSGKTIEQVLRRRAWVGVGEPHARE